MPTQIAILTPADPAAPRFEEILLALQAAGLAFEHPRSGQVFEWSAEGGQSETSVADVLQRARNAADGNVQMWFDDESDLFVGWLTGELLLYFDGVSPEQRLLSLNAVLPLVFDPEAVSAERWTIWIGSEAQAE